MKSSSNTESMLRYTLGKSAAEIRAKKTYERKKAIGKTLTSIVVIFVLCWSPVNIFMVIMDVAPGIVPIDQVKQ